MLVISNLKWKHDNFKYLNDLNNILATKLKTSLSLKINVGCDADKIIFKEVESGKLFLSSKDNKIPMKVDDPRIKKLGRTYLQTKRVTEKQFFGFFETLNMILDDLGLYADIKLFIKDKTYVIREGKDIKMELPEISSFPKENV